MHYGRSCRLDCFKQSSLEFRLSDDFEQADYLRSDRGWALGARLAQKMQWYKSGHLNARIKRKRSTRIRTAKVPQRIRSCRRARRAACAYGTRVKVTMV